MVLWGVPLHSTVRVVYNMRPVKARPFPDLSSIMPTANHVFSAFSFISFILVSIPFAWHLEAWNTATCLYMLWVAAENLVNFVNSVLWDGNIVDRAPVWCDISTRVVLGANVAIPATYLCIQRRLYHVVLNPTAVYTSREEKRRLILVDMLIGFGLPILNIALAYFAQPQRYAILENFGCRVVIIDNALGLILVAIWPLVISAISCIYGCLNIYHFWMKRRTIKTLMGSTRGSVSSSRYLRLLMLSGIDILVTIPLSAWSLSSWIPFAFPWLSFAAIHEGWSRVDGFPTSLLFHKTIVSNELIRWIGVLYALIFFLFFGFADEARRHYSSAFETVAKKVGYQSLSSLSSQNRASDQYGNTRPLRSSHRKSRSTTAYSTEFDTESKHEFRTESAPSPIPDSPHSITPQSNILSSATPWEPESKKADGTLHVEEV